MNVRPVPTQVWQRMGWAQRAELARRRRATVRAYAATQPTWQPRAVVLVLPPDPEGETRLWQLAKAVHTPIGCTVPDCPQGHHSKGLCTRHYEAMWRWPARRAAQQAARAAS